MKKSIVVSMLALTVALVFVGCKNPADGDAHQKMVAEMDSLRKAHFEMDSVYQQLLAMHEAAIGHEDGDTVTGDSAITAEEAQHKATLKDHEAMLNVHRELLQKQEETEKNHASGKVSEADLAKDHEQMKADLATLMTDMETLNRDLQEMNLSHEQSHKE